MSLFDTCATGMGSRWLRHALHHPLRDRERIVARLESVDWLSSAPAKPPYVALNALPSKFEPHPALKELESIDPDSITPRKALDLIYNLRTLLGRTNNQD